MMTPSLTSMGVTRRTTSRVMARWRTRPFAAMSSSSSSSSGPGPGTGKEGPSPQSPAESNKTPFEMEEMKKLAERTLGEQKALVSQKWEEIKASWVENKSADDATKAKAELDTSEWSVKLISLHIQGFCPCFLGCSLFRISYS